MQQADNDDKPRPSDPALTHVDVDLTKLRDFRTLLQRELDANMRPAVARIHRDHGAGVTFGARIPGVGVQAARTKYHDALSAATLNLASYIRTSELMALSEIGSGTNSVIVRSDRRENAAA